MLRQTRQLQLHKIPWRVPITDLPLPWVENRSARQLEMRGISCCHSHSVNECSCGNQSIPNRVGMGCMKRRATQSYLRIDR